MIEKIAIALWALVLALIVFGVTEIVGLFR